MPVSTSWTSIRAKLAVSIRDGADEQTLAELRRDLRAARLADTIAKTVAEQPPLTDDQRTRLVTLLNDR